MKTKVPALIVVVVGVLALAGLFWWLTSHGAAIGQAALWVAPFLATVLLIGWALLPGPDLSDPEQLRAALLRMTHDDERKLYSLVISRASLVAGLVRDDGEPYTLQFSRGGFPPSTGKVHAINASTKSEAKARTNFPTGLVNVDAVAAKLATATPTGKVMIQDVGKGGLRAGFQASPLQKMTLAPELLKR